MSKLNLQQVQTFLLGGVTFAVTQLVAFVPSLGPDKQNLISGGGAVVTAAVLLAGGLHHFAVTKGAAPAVVAPELSTEDRLRKQVTDAGMEPTA